MKEAHANNATVGAAQRPAFTMNHIGITVPNQEAATLHLCHHFGYQLIHKDPSIRRAILRREGDPLQIEITGTSASVSGQHLGFGFSDKAQALAAFDSLPSELINHRASIRKKVADSKTNLKAGMIRYSITSGLIIEHTWGKLAMAHDA